MGERVKLDPEERILAAASDEAEVNNSNEHGAGAQIEFMRRRSCQGDDYDFAPIGRAGQGARNDDLGALCRGDPVGCPWRVRVSPPTSPTVAMTDLKSPGLSRLPQFRAAREQTVLRLFECISEPIRDR